MIGCRRVHAPFHLYPGICLTTEENHGIVVGMDGLERAAGGTSQ
jgi:hypothetical protein